MKKLLALVAMCLLVSTAQAQGPVSQVGYLTAASTDCSTNASCATLPFSPSLSGTAIQLSGTFVGTIQFEGTADGANWTAITGAPISAGAGVTSATAAGTWQFGTAGLQGIRARCSAYTSGSVNVSIQAGQGTSAISGSLSTSPSGTQAVSLASGAVASGAYSSGSIASGAVASGAYATGSLASGAVASGAIASGALASGAAAAGAFSAQSFAVGAIPPAAGTLISGAVTSAMTSTTSTAVVTAAASNYQYITQCTTSNASLTVSTDILLQDGSGGTTLYVLPAPAAAVATTGGGGGTFVFPAPLKVTTLGNGLFAANVTTGSSTKISCSGFKSTVSY